MAAPRDPDATGAIWKLETRHRDLDTNLIQVRPSATIDAHTGPDIDVLIHVVQGTGQITTELGTLELRPGALVWLPARSQRRFDAGADGLRYLTIHRRRQALTLDPTTSHDNG
jgi:quercetin dioxygenase-like cupin family protein